MIGTRQFRLIGAGLLMLAPLAAERPQDQSLAAEAQRHFTSRIHELGLDSSHSFAVRSVQQDELGQSHVRVQQLYKGVPILGGEAILHFNGSGVTGRTDALLRGIGVDTRPVVKPAEALAIAHRALAPQGAYAASPTAELVIAPIEKDVVLWGSARRGEDGDVVTLTHFVLGYKVHTELENGTAETAHTDFLVDAHSGAILDRWSTLRTSAATGSGNSQYSGIVPLNTNTSGTGYELRDIVRAMNYATYDLAHATSGTGSIYTDADDTWGDGANYVEGSPTTAANGQTAAVDAHYGVGLTEDYYRNIHGRNGIDGLGTATYSRVHYSSAYDNAFWSDTCFCMTYGDGSSFLTLTSIDVAGHEMSHGVCSTTANLAYHGESGGLNEANSDINGTMVEFMAHGGGTTTVPNYTAIGSTINVYWTSATGSPSTSKPVPSANYLIGEQLATASFPEPLRFMYKPSLDGASADFWSRSVRRLDVHYSSGVANHFFFLLAHGSQADAFSDNVASPMANGVTSITGLGNDTAARIWYRALTVYMTSRSNYAAARTATLSAATDLYGSGSTEYNAVNTAWLACNVK